MRVLTIMLRDYTLSGYPPQSQRREDSALAGRTAGIHAVNPVIGCGAGVARETAS